MFVSFPTVEKYEREKNK